MVRWTTSISHWYNVSGPWHNYMCRRTEEEVVPTVGLPRHIHFVGIFKRARPSIDTGPNFLRLFRENCPLSVRLLRRAWGFRGPILVLNPRVPTGDSLYGVYLLDAQWNLNTDLKWLFEPLYTWTLVVSLAFCDTRCPNHLTNNPISPIQI